VYDLKISILFMSVAKILSDVNCLQRIFDLTKWLLTNSVLKWTNASCERDLMKCIFHFTTGLSNRNNFPLVLCRETAPIPQRRTFYEVFYIYDVAFYEYISVFSLSVWAGFLRTILEYVFYWPSSPKLE